MFDWLKRNERDMSDCGVSSPVEHLERYGALHCNLIAAHANYLARNDARLPGTRRQHGALSAQPLLFSALRPFPSGD